MPDSLSIQRLGDQIVDPEHVKRTLSIGKNTTTAFRLAYTRHNGSGSYGPLARRRVAQDIVEHAKSGCTWFPYYVLCACYRPYSPG